MVTEPVTFIERYDDNGRLSQVIERSSPAGSQINTYYSYDVAGRLKRVETDPSGTSSDQVRCWEYDQRGFLLAEEHPEIEGATDPTEEDPEPPQVDDVLFSDYDAMGHAKRSQQGVDPAPEEHEAAYLRFEFDAAARLRKVFDLQVEPGAGDDRLMKEWQFATANSGSNRKKGKVEFAFGYNYPVLSGGNPTILLRETFVYGENAGQLSQRTLDAFFNGSQQHRFVHSEQVDALGQRTRISEPVCVEPTGTPGFCAPSSLVALDVDSTYSYGLLTGMPSWLSSLAYHPNGLWSSITHANGLVETATLGADRRARPKLLTSTVGGNTLWKSGTFLYDPSGNIFGIGSTAAGAEPNEIGGVDRYLYDRAERLKHAWVTVPEAIPPTCDVFCDDFETGDVCAWDAAEPPQCGGLGGGESPAAIRVDEREYLFDLHGNIGQTNLWEGGVAQPPRVTTTVPSTNRLAGPLGDYDSRGNLTGYSTTSFTFDRLNRLIGRSVSGEPVYHFLYTADDERTLTLLDNASNQRWTMRDFGGKVLRTFVSSPSGVGLSKTYVHRGESLVAAIDNEADDVPVTSHYSTDHLGTPRLETAMSGALNQKWKYFPFGEEAVPASQEGTLLRFTGHERDIFNPGGPADDHDYMHARYFSPTTARFLSTDPVGGNPKAPQSWNRYAYVRGNPLRFIDPSGMAARRFSLLGGEINVSIDDAVEGKRQAILFERIHQALGGINSAQVNLTKSEISTIKNISSISVNPNASRAFVTESTGEQTFTPDYVETASTAFLGSAIAHDGFHVRLFWQGGLDASRGLEAERQAFTFQIEVGQKIGLSPEEIDYIKDFRDDEKLLKSYILQDPLGNKP
ncbi:MAG: RHS repeat-associated core domain-containing protein [Thermoanaerobaculia bacterium]